MVFLINYMLLAVILRPDRDVALNKDCETLKAIDVEEISIKVLLTDENLSRYRLLALGISTILIEIPSLI